MLPQATLLHVFRGTFTIVLSWGWTILAAFMPCALNGQQNTPSSDLQGKHLQIITDAPEYVQTAELIPAFDAAVTRWAEVFGIPEERLKQFRIRAYLFENRARMASVGVLPNDLPAFLHGIHRGDEVWVLRQPSAYATRHLLLHEGVHAIMSWAFRGSGAAWYSEGFAEHLATHRWNPPEIEVGIIPASREASPYWGRIGLIEKARRDEQLPALQTVLDIRSNPASPTEPYAWSWGLVTMLMSYPEYRAVMLDQLDEAYDASDRFTVKLMEKLNPSGEELKQRWRVWMNEIDYGYDVERQRLPLIASIVNRQSTQLQVAADRGWVPLYRGLSTGSQIEITAQGQIEVNSTSKPWVSEPAGITIAYHDGHPRGALQAWFMDTPAEKDGFLRPVKWLSVGTRASLIAEQGGVLWLRCNDHPAERKDNSGAFQVQATARGPSK